MVHKEWGSEEVLKELTGQRRLDGEGGSGLWTNIRLDWVMNWDQSCQTVVLLSRRQHTGRTQTRINSYAMVPKSRDSARSHTFTVFSFLLSIRVELL